MKFGKYKLSEWIKGYNGWSRYNIDYIKCPMVAIRVYHNLIEISENTIKLSLPDNAVYDPLRKIIWTVQFSHSVHSLTQLYYDLYEPKELNEDEIKNKVDKFIMRIDNLIIFS